MTEEILANFPPEVKPFFERLSKERKINTRVLLLWLVTYPDALWIQHEIHRAEIWAATNPGRAPRKNWARFFSFWLGRAWENRRAIGGRKTSIEKILGIQNGNA